MSVFFNLKLYLNVHNKFKCAPQALFSGGGCCVSSVGQSVCRSVYGGASRLRIAHGPRAPPVRRPTSPLHGGLDVPPLPGPPPPTGGGSCHPLAEAPLTSEPPRTEQAQEHFPEPPRPPQSPAPLSLARRLSGLGSLASSSDFPFFSAFSPPPSRRARAAAPAGLTAGPRVAPEEQPLLLLVVLEPCQRNCSLPPSW